MQTYRSETDKPVERFVKDLFVEAQKRTVFIPKFIMTFSRDNSTQIRFQNYTRETVEALIDDEEFPDSLIPC